MEVSESRYHSDHRSKEPRSQITICRSVVGVRKISLVLSTKIVCYKTFEGYRPSNSIR